MERLTYRFPIGPAAPLGLMRMVHSTRMLLTRLAQWFAALPALAVARARQVQRPYEIVITVLGIIFVLVFLYLLGTTSISRRH